MKKIKFVSLFLAIVLQIILVSVLLLSFKSWQQAPNVVEYLYGLIHFSAIPPAYADNILHTLSTAERILGFTISLLPTAALCYSLLLLIRLFLLYSKAQFFTKQNVKLIRKIGLSLIIWQLVINPLYEFLIGLVLTMNNPVGHREAIVSFQLTNIGILLMSIIIVMISWIMAEGVKLSEEQQLTV